MKSPGLVDVGAFDPLLPRNPFQLEFIASPRFPMFGGWSTDFSFGYALPLSRMVSRVAGTGTLKFTATFGCPLDHVVVDELVIRVVLPEGATNIQTEIPYPAIISSDTKFTYLDVTGRPVVVIRYANVVGDHRAPFVITYRFGTLGMLREPLMLVAAFIAFFAAWIAGVRLDPSLVRGEKWQLRQDREAAQSAAGKLVAAVAARGAVLARLGAALDKAQGGLTAEELAAARGSAEASLKVASAALAPALATIEAKAGGGNKGAALVARARDLAAKVRRHTPRPFFVVVLFF